MKERFRIIMTIHEIFNNELEVQINDFGAELMSIKSKSTGAEYLWEGKKEFWGRRSPVLFPIVGGLKNQQYLYEDKFYKMGQHGFARDMKFELMSKTDTEIWHVLRSNEETKKSYPFDFELELGYRLNGNNIHVLWNVRNTGDHMMYFSIGAHPAFVCPLSGIGEQEDYYLSFEGTDQLMLSDFNMESGLLLEETKDLKLPVKAMDGKSGLLPIEINLFDEGALVIEHNQTQKVSLLRPDYSPYVTVSFDAPLFGVWAPAGGKAPFVCIEPWYGRCDRENFAGTIIDREYGNEIKAKEVFCAKYCITIE